ncbi:MAG: nucleobase:cation symporter-2 family protein [Pseudomonadota bacterium]
MAEQTVPDAGVSAVDQVLPPGPTVALALQHLLAAYASLVVTPLVLAAALDLPAATLTQLISAALLTSGVCTLIQCLGLGPHIGIRLPVVQGTTIAAVPALILIGAEHGLTAIFGATLVAGLAAALAAGLWSRLLVLFPPVVTGTVITAIGISLLPVAIMWMSGGGAPGAQVVAPQDMLLGFGSLAIVVLILRFGHDLLARSAILIGLVAGTLLAASFGDVSLARVAAAPWFTIVTPLEFGMPTFPPSACIAMLLVMLVTMIESTGDYLAIGEVCHEPVEPHDIAAGIRAEGIGTMLGGLMNSFPFTTFSQNTGVLRISGVRSRWVVAVTALFMIGLGLVPKLGALVAIIPTPVLGGCALVMFGSIAATGMHTLRKVDLEDNCNLVVVSVSLGLSLLVIANPLFFDGFGASVKIALGNAITLAGVSAVSLNALFSLLRTGSSEVSGP